MMKEKYNVIVDRKVSLYLPCCSIRCVSNESNDRWIHLLPFLFVQLTTLTDIYLG